MMRRITRVQTAIAVLLLVPIVYLVIALAGPSLRAHQRERQKHAAIEKQVKETQSLWKSENFIPISDRDPEDIAAIIDRAVGSEVLGRNDVLTKHQRAKFVETLSEQAAGRASASPEVYLTMAKDDRATRWIEPTDEADWHRTRMFYERELGHEPTGTDPSQWLKEFVTNEFDTGHRLAAIADGSGGARILVFRVRAVEQIGLEASRAMNEAEFQYWFANNGYPSANFRVARRSIDEVISEEGSALIALVNLLVRTDDDTVYNWHSIWYWDSVNEAWQVFVMARKGWSASMFN